MIMTTNQVSFVPKAVKKKKEKKKGKKEKKFVISKGEGLLVLTDRVVEPDNLCRTNLLAAPASRRQPLQRENY